MSINKCTKCLKKKIGYFDTSIVIKLRNYKKKHGNNVTENSMHNKKKQNCVFYFIDLFSIFSFPAEVLLHFKAKFYSMFSYYLYSFKVHLLVLPLHSFLYIGHTAIKLSLSKSTK